VVGGVVGWVREGWVDWLMGGRRERARGVYGLFSLISTICIYSNTDDGKMGVRVYEAYEVK
jgi:hypothetical protein